MLEMSEVDWNPLIIETWLVFLMERKKKDFVEKRLLAEWLVFPMEREKADFMKKRMVVSMEKVSDCPENWLGVFREKRCYVLRNRRLMVKPMKRLEVVTKQTLLVFPEIRCTAPVVLMLVASAIKRLLVPQEVY